MELKERSDYVGRLAQLRAEQERVKAAEEALTAKRRVEIGRIAEKLDLLGVSDSAMTGALLELKSALANPERLQRFERIGCDWQGGKQRKAQAVNGLNGLDAPYSESAE
jgi:hypothetical protein